MKIKTYKISKSFEGRNNQWYFNVKGMNGHIILQTEGYTQKGSADRARLDLAGANFELEQ